MTWTSDTPWRPVPVPWELQRLPFGILRGALLSPSDDILQCIQGDEGTICVSNFHLKKCGMETVNFKFYMDPLKIGRIWRPKDFSPTAVCQEPIEWFSSPRGIALALDLHTSSSSYLVLVGDAPSNGWFWPNWNIYTIRNFFKTDSQTKMTLSLSLHKWCHGCTPNFHLIKLKPLKLCHLLFWVPKLCTHLHIMGVLPISTSSNSNLWSCVTCFFGFLSFAPTCISWVHSQLPTLLNSNLWSCVTCFFGFSFASFALCIPPAYHTQTFEAVSPAFLDS